MENRWIVFGILILSLSVVLAVDLETRVGFGGDGELLVNYVGDEENSMIGSGEDSVSPLVSVNSPSEGVTYTSSPVFFNVSMNEVGSCNYSVDGGVSNSSMTSSGLSFIATRELSNAAYSASFYCSDSAGNLNLSENVSFVVGVAAVETPAAGGGGGAAVSDSVAVASENGINLNIDRENFKIRSVVGDFKTREFGVKNDGDEKIEVNLRVEGEEVELRSGELVFFESLIEFDESNVSLEPGEELNLKFKVEAPRSLGIFVGEIIIEILGVEERIPISISTQSKETIFDVISTIIDDTIEDSSNVKVQIDLLPIGEKGVDITLEYTIKDFKSKVYFENSETFYVDGPMSFVKEFPTSNLIRGEYVLGVEMIYLGGFASASSQFEVIDESIFGDFKLTLGSMFLIIIISVIILIAIIIYVRLNKIKRYKK